MAPSRSSSTVRRAVRSSRPHTLAIDIGGTGLKASVLDARGRMLSERVRVETPHPITPSLLVRTLATLVAPLPRYNRISVGFPGVIRHGVVRTAPNLGTEAFAGFDLERALERRLGKPTRVINDADMQGYAAIRGKGVEMVITLGTGFGSALFQDGMLAPHLELAHHPFRKGDSYEDELGDEARDRLGNKRWKKLVWKAVDQLRELVCFDRLFIGGGNARHFIGDPLPRDVSLVDNTAGILGGIKLWDSERRR